jgi:S-adenosylmethionine:tRNA ribosyltransferase-isomerase
MDLAHFDYDLPEELIAQRPTPERDASRLMVLRRDDQSIEHRVFRDIGRFLRQDDCLILNNTRVIPARLMGVKPATGARIEALLLRPLDDGAWEALLRPGKRVRPGTRMVFGDGALHARALGRSGADVFRLRFDETDDFRDRLDRVGQVPLPPYVKRPADEEDRLRYQNVFARRDGAVAAPTAGLHFTNELLDNLRAAGVRTVEITLHVGLGTFQPVQTQVIEEHRLHAEYAELSREAASALRTQREKGGRLVPVGTTCVRTLESAVRGGTIRPFRGWTDLFIYPGFAFRATDALVTNFHLPKSSLLMLVAALVGLDFLRRAYAVAVAERYRFYSYGDAMLVV